MNAGYDVAAYRRVLEDEFSWLSGCERNARRYADRPALIDAATGETLNYRALNACANRFANALAARGVGAGDVVLYQLMNSIEFALCYLAPQKLGAVNSPVNFNLAAGELRRILENDRPKAFVYGREFLQTAQAALAESAHRPEIVLCADELCAFSADASDARPLRTGTPNMYDETTRLFTSGTTSLPKEIPLCAANELMSAHDVIMQLQLTPADVTMNLTPWFHRGGLHSGGLTPTLYVGGCCVMLCGFGARACMDAVLKYGVSYLIGVPSVMLSLAARQERHPVDLSGLRGAVLMGSPLEHDVCKRFQALLTPRIFNGYGTTETFWNCLLRPEDLPEMAGSAGRACIDDEARVVCARDGLRAEPEDTVPQDNETVGEIILYAPLKSTLCYRGLPELTNQKFHRGWLYTGDLGVWDAAGFVRVSGRRDDMIVCKGENIYPAQIEEALCRVPGVRDAIVTGVCDSTRGQTVAAYVIAEPGVTIPQIHQGLIALNDLPEYKRPRFYALVNALPYTPTGKKRHAELRARAAADLEAGVLRNLR